VTASPRAVERELKLGVWPEFELPDLASGIEDGTMGPPTERRLEAVYFDTADLRLLRRGITLRFRHGDDAGPLWTAKLPAEAPALGLARREISLSGRPGPVPALLQDLTRGWALGARLEPVARIVTARRSVPLLDRTGAMQASIDDDEVVVLRGRRVAARFRELEVELAERARGELLASVAEVLWSAGAQPVPQVPKLVYALGPAATEPWDLAVPELGPQPSAADMLRRRLVEAAGPGFVDHHAAVVLGEHPDAVREMRCAVRRLVADLRAFEPLLDAEASRPLREELAWLADRLEPLEGADELLAELRADIGSGVDLVAADGDLDALLSDLVLGRARVRERLLAMLRTARYRALLAQLVAFVVEPALGSAKARRPAAEVMRSLARDALRALRHEVESAPEPLDDPVLRGLEWPVERLRSAIESAVPLAGPSARRAAREVMELRLLLDDHRRTLLGARLLQAAAASSPDSWTAGVLAGGRAEHAAACRERFPRVWRHLARKSRWAWLD
jgi:inorganic triphosphatase YgiF